MPPYLLSQWIGSGPEVARATATEATGELLARPAERLILDLTRLADVCDGVGQAMLRLISETQRNGRNICLVRCPDDLFRRLQRAGLRGAVTHASSLLAATQGLAGEPANTLELHLRSAPQLLHRLRSVVSAIAREAGLTGSAEVQLKTAVTEAAANAIVHGSPEGQRNHVHVSFHLDARELIIDVADQGPGFEPGGTPFTALAELQEHGYGLEIMRQAMDRVEFYRDEHGMLVRMTKYLSTGSAGWA